MSINVYKHLDENIKVCFKCVFVLCFIGEIRSNGRINEEIELQKDYKRSWRTYFVLMLVFILILGSSYIPYMIYITLYL